MGGTGIGARFALGTPGALSMSQDGLAKGPHPSAVQLEGQVAPLEGRLELVGSLVEAVGAVHLPRTNKRETLDN